MTNVRELDPSASPLDYYGAELRRFREAAGLTLKQLGACVFCTGSLIGQIETARKVATKDFTLRVDTALDTEGALMRIWRLVMRSQLPAWFQPYADLEAKATHIHSFQLHLVHGLLQTEEYARAVLGVLEHDKLDERVAARMERHHILEREDPPLFWAIMSEAVLYQEIGGKEVMRGQLAHLLSFLDNPWVNIQILPFSAGAHTGMAGSFNILRFEDDPEIVYDEHYEPRMTANPEELRMRSLRYDHLQAAALSVEKSAELIGRVMEERYGEQHGADRSVVA
ncbi:helix-turn-helix domain-containing protein [Streptomyces sp. PTM05]|uniref:Helix-turn-helix domain-containing protein n=1 Tax=Streptantibioticus parmotrematis TaxID=2873249 RepID=A0ABS7QTG8_9ACTN|nr:helix-turn-helix transcriptional regulator [Streptantibioticus parmotrematis]MBY8886203.1 helix-turn-helix domain-containing protein [Streptantibioticus parmotrematis]